VTREGEMVMSPPNKMHDLFEFGIIFQKFSLKIIINFRIPFIGTSLLLFAPLTRDGGGSKRLVTNGERQGGRSEIPKFGVTSFLNGLYSSLR
jgi:hypothetical protein